MTITKEELERLRVILNTFACVEDKGMDAAEIWDLSARALDILDEIEVRTA